jgi:ferredoxin-NADP reductase
LEAHIVNIQSIRQITHEVRSYRVEKPKGYSFIPGQATEVAINKPAWKDERRPFTFTSLATEATLEFTIKSYTDRHGVTDEFYRLQVGDSIIIHDVWGAIAYKGPGYFIAGGAGITPFIAILRQLYKEQKLEGNKLFFANKTARDIILEDELKRMLGRNLINVLSQGQGKGPYLSGHIDEAFLKRHIDDFKKHFYICGPDPMVAAISETLQKLGAVPDAVVFEK